MKVSKARRKFADGGAGAPQTAGMDGPQQQAEAANGDTQGGSSVPSDPVTTLLLAVLALAATSSLICCQVWGVGLTPDSTVYISAARNLAAGRGYVTDVGLEHPEALTDYPPLFPAALAVLDWFGLDPIEGTMWLNAFLLAANAFLGGLAVHQATGGSRWTAVLATVTIATGTAMLLVHSMAWSEPLFLLLSLGGAMLLARHLERGGRRPLVVAAVCLALAFLTRYVGLAVIGSAALGLGLLSPGSPRRRLRKALIFGLLAALPGLVWLVRNRLVGGSATYGAGLAFHPIPAGHLLQALETIGRWFWPEELGKVAGASRIMILEATLGAIVLLGLYSRFQPRTSRPPERTTLPRLVPVLAILAAGYLLALVLSISFVAVNTPMTPRILSPVFLFGVIAALCSLRHLPAVRGLRWPGRTSLAVAAVVFAATGCIAAARWLIDVRTFGQGFHSRTWQLAPVLELVRTYPGRAPIYSNWHNAVYILTNKPPLRLPVIYNPANLKPNEHFVEQLQAIRHRCDHGEGGLLVLIRSRGRPYQPSERQLIEALQPLWLIYDDHFSALYQILPKLPTTGPTSGPTSGPATRPTTGPTTGATTGPTTSPDS